LSGDGARAPVVSVIVPTYQRRELVRRAVASVLSQTFRNFELIVVDDGSTDGTAEALADFGGQLRYVWRENAGAAAARNTGLRLARGRNIAFLDSDDRWLPDHLAMVVRALEDHPEAVLAYSGSTLQPRPRERAGTGHITEPMPAELVTNYVGALPCVAVRRQAITRVGGFDERLGLAEDTDLWLRLAAHGCSFVRVPRRTLVAMGETKGSVITSRRRGAYVEALEASTERVIGQLESARDEGTAARARGRRHFLRALVALSERDEGAVRAELADACRLLPELSASPPAVVSHVRFNVAAAEGRAERARQLATVARLWPDRTSEVARVVPAHAFVDAVAAARPAEALRLSAEVSAQLAFSVFRARLRRVLRRRLPRPPAEATVRAVHRVLLRTGRGPLRPVWRLAHGLLARSVSAYLRGGDPRTSAYVSGSLAGEDAVFGLSDIDLTVVLEDREDLESALRDVSERWRDLGRRLPALRDHVFETPQVYGQAELDAAASHTTLTHEVGSGPVSPSSRERRRELGGAERPGVYGLTSDWRLLGGPDLRPPVPPRDNDELRVAAWMELQFWWLMAFKACVEPAAPWAAHLCAKLLVEPARIWLWLVRGERILDRQALIRRAMVELPEEEEALRLAQRLLSSVTLSPAAPVEEALRSLTRMSARLADAVSPDPETADTTQVRLVHEDPGRLVVRPSSLAAMVGAAGMDGAPVPLPLADWRARTWSLPDECLAFAPGKATDVSLLAAAALACNDGAYAALRHDGLIVLPSLGGARLRAVQCAATDPVSFALAEGGDHAAFPDVPGWSARDCARRAAAEHLGWLRDEEGREHSAQALGRLLAAARAALFHQSIETGAPELALDAASVVQRLGDELARDAYEGYRAGRLAGESPPPDLVEAFRRAVERLRPYSEAIP
jgi:hypothetical protein